MKSSQRLILATVSLLTFATPASSNSVLMLDSPPKAGNGSIIFLGEPLDCSVDACAEPEPAEVKAAPASGAMIDAFGMPTKMPTILRGGQSSDDAVIMAPADAKPAPAAVAPQAPEKAEEMPEPAPAPVAEAPAMPEPPAPVESAGPQVE